VSEATRQFLIAQAGGSSAVERLAHCQIVRGLTALPWHLAKIRSADGFPDAAAPRIM
jgi:hypothetical protein